MTTRSAPMAILAMTVVAVALLACSGGGAASTSTPAITVRTAESAATASATASASPTPPATVTPSPVGFANPGENAGAFPPPPPNPNAEPASTRGIARVVASKLGVDHYIEVVGIVNNEMQAPDDGMYAIGWYAEYGLPGAGGNVMITAHETWNHMQGPFYGLNRAALGDEIEVKMAGGRSLVYRVISNRRYPVVTIPMADIIWPKIRPANEEWLTMLTCGGRIVYGADGFGEYLDRDVIVARRVK